MSHDSYIGWWFIASGPIMGLHFEFPNSWLTRIVTVAWVLVIIVPAIYSFFEE